MEKINCIIRQLLTGCIRFYQLFSRSIMPPRCRFYPSCSDYAKTAILELGIIKGLWLTFLRLLRCQPWAAGGYDPVTTKKEEKS
jgi:putative membrane protein insertion efficiency factor